jgi:hypothetical protein
LATEPVAYFKGSWHFLLRSREREPAEKLATRTLRNPSAERRPSGVVINDMLNFEIDFLH